MSRIISSARDVAHALDAAAARRLEARADDDVRRQRNLRLAELAARAASSRTRALSGSYSDLPTLAPDAASTVFAMPPPRISSSTFVDSDCSTSIFVETFEPPMIATQRALRASRARPRAPRAPRRAAGPRTRPARSARRRSCSPARDARCRTRPSRTRRRASPCAARASSSSASSPLLEAHVLAEHELAGL